MGTTALTPRDMRRQEKARRLLLTLARRIRQAREKQRMTQEEFAARCGISVSFASLLERGERSPSYETLLDVAETLGLTLAELFLEAPVTSPVDPYFTRLVDFAQSARLTHSQVDRFLSVGHAMFGLELTHIERPTLKVEGGHCNEEGCQRPVLAKGLCASHYHRRRRNQL